MNSTKEESHIFEFSTNPLNNIMINIENYTEKKKIITFSTILSMYKKRGTIAFYSVSVERLLLLVLSAWYAGWKVAIIPENKLDFINKDLDLTILINGSDVDNELKSDMDYLSLFIKDNRGILFDSWLKENIKIEKKPLESYLWERDETALVLFTSGSTGKSKGVCHSLQAMIYSAERFCIQFSIGRNDKLLNTAAVHTMSGFRASIMLSLLNKCKVISPKDNVSMKELLYILENESPSMMIVGPNIVNQISILSDKLEDFTKSLKFILCTGAKLERKFRIKIYETLGIPVIDYYGLTETSGLSISESIDDYSSENESIGKRCKDIKLVVILKNDTESLFGEGELRVYSNSLYLGYLGEKEKLNKYFNTGDQVIIQNNGDVFWQNRIKNGIKSSITTEWVYPEILESWLRKQPLIKDIHVTTFYDDYNRLGFKVEVVGISESEWILWKQEIFGLLSTTLGVDYRIINWIRAEKIIRSNLGKFQYTVMEK